MVDSEYNIPSQWKDSIIVSIPKKGFSLSLDNQRGIAKSCAICKLRNKILFNRIMSVTESKLLGIQSDFRSDRSTTEQIMKLHFLLDATRTQKCSLIVVFVDYSNAFDSVDRRAIPVVLRHYGVPDPVVADVMQLYHGSTTAVLTCFDTTSGVLQGDTLSPHLFILLVDYILRQPLVDEDGFTLKPANGRRHPAVTLTALSCADDVAITSDSASGAESTLLRLQFHSEMIVLKLNVAKTKVLHVGYESDPEPILTLDGTTIDVCDIYNYLGLPTLSSKVVIRQRFAATWSAIGKLRPMFHSTAPDALKINVIAAYALESLPLNPTTSSILDAGYRQMICAALGINWRNNITNEEVYAKSGLLPFSQTIRKRRLHLIGHSLRLQNRSTTPLGSMLQNLNVVFSLRRGQGRAWTLAKDLLNDLNAIDCNFSSSQFTRLVDSNFYC